MPVVLSIPPVTIYNVTLQVMSSIMSRVNEIVTYLSKRKSSISCAGSNGLREFMKELGFDDTQGDTPGHRVFTHQKLSQMAGFISTSVDCGHKPRREMKLPYVVKTLNTLRKYQVLLEQIENEGKKNA